MGVIFSLLAAFFVSFRTAFEKRALKGMDEFSVALGFRFFALCFILIIIFSFGVEWSFEEEIFWKLVIIGGVLNTGSSLLVMKALKMGELSLVGPMATFSPLFILATSPLIVGEFPPFEGLIGVLLIVSGAYILNTQKEDKDFKAPIVFLLNKNKGSLYMLGAAFIWSIGANLDKLGVEASSPLLWAASINAFVILAVLPFVLRRKSTFTEEKVFRPVYLLFAGLAGALVAIFQLYAISMILVVYVISLKRMSAIFEVFIGHFAFKEKDFKKRLLGSLIMTAGAVIIIFAQYGVI